MRRPINWLVVFLSVGFLVLGRTQQAHRPAPLIIERTPYVPTVAAAVPAPLRLHAEPEFGYIESDR
jgi:hypothetical protein